MTQTSHTPHSFYPTIQSDVQFVALEQDVLRFWKEQRVFEASVNGRSAEHADGSSNAYVFYDGPPFANGLPHHGHLLTGFVKDAVARYQTMRGHRVERRFGWDCHGLPAEMETEKQLGVSGRQDIIAYGVEKFNEHCRTSVMRYRDEWEFYVGRQARWVDFERDYKTMDTPYMESVLWAFSELYKKGLIYEGFKVMPYSWSAETVLSSSEIRLDDATREKVDKAVTVAFKLKERPEGAPDADEYYLLAWTTTPWTLPSNLALAVSKNIEYEPVLVRQNTDFFKKNECVFLSKAQFRYYYKELGLEGKSIGLLNPNVPSILGEQLIGLSYEPLFPYFADHPNAFKVLDGSSFIEEGSGTGIVHMAPGFGEDDMRVCAENGISVVVPVDEKGRYTDAIYNLTRIETSRCILKTPTAVDEANFIRLNTNEDVMNTMNDGVMTVEQAKADFAANLAHFKEHGYGQWAVYHRETGEFMGRAGLSFVAQSSEMPIKPTLRCGLLPEFWRGGYGSELCAASLDYGFRTLHATDIAGGAVPHNPRAHAMMERLGMRHIKDVMFKRMMGKYFLITQAEWSDAVIPAEAGIQKNEDLDSRFRGNDDIYTLSLKGLNVISETNHKRPDEPYTPAQLEKYGLANLRIIQWLKATGQLVKQEDYAHNYPHCWRTDKPIIYKAMSSWFVDVPKIRDRMVELNQDINWIPSHIKDGRFGKWLEGAREWSISRSRFWGCPIPVWRSDNPDNNELYVFGSVAELQEFFGAEVTDLHKPAIDHLTKPDPTNPAYTIKRVDEVFDCWFESGSMPFAQVHYPFENKAWFEANFPADFIVEYEAQTRGWFYNMMVLSVGLFDSIPFKNCICHGVVLDDQGRKLSKRLKNYIDPKELFDTYGSDALRWFMLSSTIMRGQELFLDAQGHFIRDAIRLYIKPLWNAYHFFCLYANADEVQAQFDLTSSNLMDRYIMAKLKGCVDGVRDALDAYDTPTATATISAFLEVLNNWYIRRNRSRFWGTESGEDKVAAYNTLYSVLHTLCRIAAPFLPQVTEAMFAGLTNGGEYAVARSVHLTDYPIEFATLQADIPLMKTMDRVQDICNTAHAIRNDVAIRIRQPLATLTVYSVNETLLAIENAYFSALIADEVNVKEVIFSDGIEDVARFNLKINFPIVGKKFSALMKDIASAAKRGEYSLAEDGNNLFIAGVVLLDEDYEFTLESTIKTGAGALSAQDGLVVLDTVLTPALIQEGIARDIVRLVQQSRKEAGFDVADRIMLVVEATGAVADAAQAFAGYICEQTLATSLHMGNAGASPHPSTHELTGQQIRLGLQTVMREAKAG